MADPRQDKHAQLIALLRERPNGLTWRQLTELVLQHGSAAATRAHLVADGLFADNEYVARLDAAERDLHSWLVDGVELWSVVDDQYPARVRDIMEAPPFLFARGQRIDDDVAVSVVGSRKATDRGLRIARDISAALVSRNITVIAGLAAGIDTAAHTTALAAGGRTVAVIGTGIRQHYPAANRGLQERIAREGLLLSQFWPDAPPLPRNFPMRNAVMSGYGIATVVVEAGEHSGARIQARLAVHHGRPVILTDLVVERTAWGRELLDYPDVYLASSVNDVMARVDRLARRSEDLEQLLRQITI